MKIVKVELIRKQLSASFLFEDEKILSGGDCNNPQNLSQFKIFYLAILTNFDIRIA